MMILMLSASLYTCRHILLARRLQRLLCYGENVPGNVRKSLETCTKGKEESLA